MVSKTNNYLKEFAKVYDLLMSPEYYMSWENLINSLIKKYNIPKGEALDLACGTGKIAKILDNEGFAVTGMDLSKDMLIEAKKNISNGNIKFIQKNMTNFKIFNRYSLVTCFYDSINYLSSLKKIEKMMKNVSYSLILGGYFIFDINTKEKIKILQKRPPFETEIAGRKVQMNNSGKDNVWELNIKIKELKTEAEYQERHLERGYSKEEIISASKAAGLKFIDSIDEIKTIENKSYISRQYFMLRKI